MSFIDRFFVRGTVSEIVPVARRMRRLRITGDAIACLRPLPGQQVRLIVGELFGLDLVRNDAVRTYSVWDHSTSGGHLDLCVLDHDHAGPGARFARSVEVGQSVSFAGPEGRFVLQEDAPAHVFFGEETAQVAFGAMLRALPSGARATGVVEVASIDDALALPGDHALRFVPRGVALGGALVDAARTTPIPPDAIVYLAGEAKVCKAVRNVLVDERKVPRRRVLSKPFWTPGAKGLE